MQLLFLVGLFHLLVNKIFPFSGFFLREVLSLRWQDLDISSVVESASSSSSSSSPRVTSPLSCHTIFPADADQLQELIKIAKDDI